MFTNNRLRVREYLPRRFGAVTLGLQPPSASLPSTPTALTYIPPGGAYVTVPGIEGTWVFSQVGGEVSGEFEIWREGEQYKGKIRVGLTGPWMDLIDVSYDERTRELTFYSPYWGNLKGYAAAIPPELPANPYTIGIYGLDIVWFGNQRFTYAESVQRAGLPVRAIKWKGVLAGNQLTGKWIEHFMAIVEAPAHIYMHSA